MLKLNYLELTVGTVHDRCPVYYASKIRQHSCEFAAVLWGALVYSLRTRCIHQALPLTTLLHSTPQPIQSYSQGCSVLDQIKSPKRTKPDDVFILRTILTGHFESCKAITRSIARSSKNKLDSTEGLVVRCTSWALSGCDVKDNSEGEPVPSAGQGPDAYRK